MLAGRRLESAEDQLGRKAGQGRTGWLGGPGRRLESEEDRLARKAGLGRTG